MGKVIEVAPRAVLLAKDYIFDLSASVSRVAVVRRLIVEEGTLVLYGWVEFGGSILDGNGKPIAIYPGVFDDAHGEGSEGEWISGIRGRSEPPQRNPRKSLARRLELYDALFRIAGRPVGNKARREHVAEVRELLSSFTPVWRARYVNDVRKLRKQFRGRCSLRYGAAIRMLRTRFAAERAAWLASQ